MGRIVDTNQLIQLLTDWPAVGGCSGLDMLVQSKDPANTVSNPQQKWMHKEARAAGAVIPTTIAGQWYSTWQLEGVGGSGDGAVPTGWVNPTNTTAGAFRQADPTSPRKLRTTWAWGSMWDSGGSILVYDRLAHCGGLDATLTTAQNVNGGSAGAITRYSGAVGNFIWFEIYTLIGATGTTITASYTNEGGTSGRTTQPVAIGATGRREAQRIIWASLAQGDKSPSAVTSVTALATTGTAGNFGVTVAHPLFMIPCGQPNSGNSICFEDGPISEILTGACLSMIYMPIAATNNVLELALEFEEFV